MPDINWSSFIPAFIGALIPVLGAIAAIFFAWGRISEKVLGLDRNVTGITDRQNTSNGKLEKQAEKDGNLQSEIEAVKARCGSRESLWRRNNEDHVEIFSRLNSLEKGLASLPMQVSDTMDRKLEKWREHIRADVRLTIEEIDKEKMKFQRRKTDGHGDDEEWD